jgi:predicted RNA-binding Zn-ribbon protein involved in translation (DUF1610 family)
MVSMAEESKYYCKNCGVEIKPNDTLCPKCGKNLNEVGREIRKTVYQSIGFSYEVKTINRSDKTKLVGRFLIYFIIAIIAVVTVFEVSFSVTRFFPDYVPISDGNDLLNIMISVDGILLGFVGIVFAQLLSSVSAQQNVLYQRILEKPLEAEENKKTYDFLDGQKYALSLVTVITFGSLIGSIFISMANIAKNSLLKSTDTFATFALLFGPLLYTIIAVVFLTLALAILPLKPSLVKKKEA